MHILDMDNWVIRYGMCFVFLLHTLIIHSALECSCIAFQSSWPKTRPNHLACALFGPTPSSASEGSSKEILHSPTSDTSSGQHKPQLFVLWGFLNISEEPFIDAWILDINSITWKLVILSVCVLTFIIVL